MPLGTPSTVYRQDIGIDFYFDHQGTTGRVQHLMPGLDRYYFEGPDGQRWNGTLIEPMPSITPLNSDVPARSNTSRPITVR